MEIILIQTVINPKVNHILKVYIYRTVYVGSYASECLSLLHHSIQGVFGVSGNVLACVRSFPLLSRVSNLRFRGSAAKGIKRRRRKKGNTSAKTHSGLFFSSYA